MDVNLANWSSGLTYAGGVLLLVLLLRLLGRPLRWVLRLAASSVAGGLMLWLFNLAVAPWGLHVGINPVSAFLVGVLGLPGLVCLGLIRWVLG